MEEDIFKMTDNKFVEINPKKVNNLDELDQLEPGDRVFATIVIHDDRKLDYMFFEGKIDDKYSFMDPFANFPGAPVTCYRNTPEQLKFNNGQIILKMKDYQIYTIENPKEYNKRRKLMGLREFLE